VIAEQGIERRRTALERHSGRVRLRQHLEHVFGDDAGRRSAIGEGKRFRLRGLQEFRQGAGGIGGVDAQALAVDRHERHRTQVRGGIAGVFVEGLVDGIAVAGEQDRVAVGRRGGDRLGGDVGGRPRPVLDHDGPAEPLAEALGDHRA
jgi:hypothetical protein